MANSPPIQMKRPSLTALFAAAAVVVGCGRTPTVPSNVVENRTPTFLEQRQDFRTNLIRSGPAPQEYDPVSPPDGVREIVYRSGNLDLKAWYAVPNHAAKSVPAVVCFHSGHAFASDDFEMARMFLDAGFAVLTPMLRAENGNPGEFELFWGEFDDACNAVRWLASQPEIDSNRVYAFGHSVGGGLSSLLSLAPRDLPLRDCGSSGGLYVPQLFEEGGLECPFDISVDGESRLRTLAGNLPDMNHPRLAYIGSHDVMRAYSETLATGETQLDVHYVMGDHWTSYTTAAGHYLAHIAADAGIDLADRQPFIAWQADFVEAQQDIESPVPEFWNVQPSEIQHRREYLRATGMHRIGMGEHVTIPIVPDNYLLWWYGDLSFDIIDIRDYTAKSRMSLGLTERIEVVVNPRGDQVAHTFNRSASAPNEIKISGRLSKQLTRPRLIPSLLLRFVGEERILTRDEPDSVWIADTLTTKWTQVDFLGGNSSPTASPSQKGYKSPVALSPDYRYIAAVNVVGDLVVCDSETGQQCGRVKLPQELRDQIDVATPWDATFSPDGTEFSMGLTIKRDNYLLNWDLNTGQLKNLHKVSVPLMRGLMQRNVLQFLDGKHGWIAGNGSVAVTRESGEIYWRSPFAIAHQRVRSLPGGRIMQIVDEPGSQNKLLIVNKVTGNATP